MKILWFSNTPSLASTNLNLKNFSGGWIDSLEAQLSNVNDISLSIAFYYKSKTVPQIDNNVKYYPIKKTKIKDIVLRLFGKYPNPNKEVKKYLRIINDFKPDIIHIFGTENLFCEISRYIDIPIIVHLQGFIHKILEDYCGDFSKLELIKYSDLKSLLFGNNPIFRYLQYKKHAKREIFYIKNIKYFDGRTDWDKKIISKNNNSAKYFHCDELLRNSYYIKNSKREYSKYNNSKVILLSVISEQLYKGFYTILKTAELLTSESNIFFQWNIIGITPFHNNVKMVKKKTGLSLSKNNINILGKKDSLFIAKMMNKSNLFILPSYIENSPNTLCEAMIMGIPTISTNVGGIPSILENKKEGLLIEPHNERLLFKNIIDLLDSPNLQKQYCDNASIRANIRHNKNLIIDNIYNIYSNILNK